MEVSKLFWCWGLGATTEAGDKQVYSGDNTQITVHLTEDRCDKKWEG